MHDIACVNISQIILPHHKLWSRKNFSQKVLGKEGASDKAFYKILKNFG